MIIQGDCIQQMKKIKENSVDAIITDPPYGIGFMGKEWDKFKQGKNIAGGTTGKDTPFGRSKPLNSVYQYNLQQKHDMQNFFYTFSLQAIRILKPGGFLLAMGGTRTYHRLVCGIEDAGFEIRDTIMWLYGSGFPKSLNIGKQIDKVEGNERKIIGYKEPFGREGRNTKPTGNYNAGIGGNYNENTKDLRPIYEGSNEWEGWGTALKPACEPIVVARKPLSEKNVALNVLKWGTGGINVDGCRIEFEDTPNPATNPKYRLEAGYKIPEREQKSEGAISWTSSKNKTNVTGRFPANIILDEQAGKMLDEQSGNLSQGHWSKTKTKGFGEFGGGSSEYFGVGEKDKTKHGASRFFQNINKGCFLCYNTLTKDNNKEWKNINANNVEKNLKTTQAIKESSVQKNAMEILKEKLAQNVKCVGNLCPLCVTNIARILVEIRNSDSKKEELIAGVGYITEFKRNILIQNLVQFVELWENIDTIPTTENLMLLFGSVQNAIKDYTLKENNEILRFKYTPKASKSERNFGCEDLEKKQKISGKDEYVINNICPKHKKQHCECGWRSPAVSNHHPTVKPIKLMEYLVKLVSKEGATVLDPFLGSGTTMIACLKLNRKCIGIEKEEEYIKIAKARIKPFQEQTKLA